MNMFEIKEYVLPSSIWPTAENPKEADNGPRQNYLRGYNIEVETADGHRVWLSCEWINSDPLTRFNDEFYQWYYKEHQWTPTGRICFRGYVHRKNIK